MAFARFERLLKDTMGLDAASVGPSAIASAVRERLSACNLKGANAYWDYVRASDAELQELVEAAVVTETWFFRDRHAFGWLGRAASEGWLPAHPDRVLRLLSLPSSTGEEPYSMAMTLIDAGVPASRFRIDAIDISGRALARAERGVYGKNSFRENDPSFRERHFDLTASGYRIRDTVREPVQFQQGNLLASSFLPDAEPYDVIFCRNVLIYFDRGTQDRAVTLLERLLAATGVLFVAPPETGVVLSRDFVSIKEPLAFGFRKPGAAIEEPPPIATRAVRQHPVPPPAVSPAALPARRRAVAPAAHAPAAETAREIETTVGLDQATQLAGQGRFTEASACCERYLHEHGPTAGAFHLLGLVQEATGNAAQAAAYYRKALYLEPHREEVLIHLALLLEKQDNAEEAKVLRNRARRLRQAIA